jgi:hypothetical protein
MYLQDYYAMLQLAGVGRRPLGLSYELEWDLSK